MKYEITFNRDSAHEKFMEIYTRFARTEECAKAGDLPRNIRNACAFSEAVRSLRIFGAAVLANGIYDDNGFDRIGHAVINGHEFVKNGEFNFAELSAALAEIVGNDTEEEG